MEIADTVEIAEFALFSLNVWIFLYMEMIVTIMQNKRSDYAIISNNLPIRRLCNNCEAYT